MITKLKNISIIVLVIIIILLLWNNNKIKNDISLYKNNIEYLKDSLRYEHEYNDRLVASHRALVIERKNLKEINKKLDEEIKKVKGKVIEVIKTKSVIVHDTVEVVTNYTVYNTNGIYNLKLNWEYDTSFTSEDWYVISGYNDVKLDSSMGVLDVKTVITKHDIGFSLITGLREKDKKVEIFVTSNYPGLKPTSIDGAIIDPKKHPIFKKYSKKKKIGIGPYVGIGINGVGKLSPQIGVGLQYNLIKF
jgi:hypothetical protein